VSRDRIAESEAELARLGLEKEALQDEFETLKRRFFGRSSEKNVDDAQPQLFDEQQEELGDFPVEETPVRAHTRKSTGRKPLPQHLQQEDVVIDIPEEDK